MIDRVSAFSGALLLVVLALVLAPAAVPAATLSALARPCVAEASALDVVGTGFTPGAAVRVTPQGRGAVTATAGPDGRIRVRYRAPRVTAPGDPREQRFSVTASDGLNTATGAYRVVRPSLRFAPRAARTDRPVRLVGRGWLPGRRVYAHYRPAPSRRWRRITVIARRARGTCGEFRVFPRLFRRLASGRSWLVQIDQRRRPSRRTRPSAFILATIRPGIPAIDLFEKYIVASRGYRDRR